MKNEFLVIEADGNPTWNTKTESPEKFGSYQSAERRAREVAASSPGESIRIFESVGEVIAPVGKIQSYRKP